MCRWTTACGVPYLVAGVIVLASALPVATQITCTECQGSGCDCICKPINSWVVVVNGVRDSTYYWITPSCLNRAYVSNGDPSATCVKVGTQTLYFGTPQPWDCQGCGKPNNGSYECSQCQNSWQVFIIGANINECISG